jgi:hypothetical protein
LGGKMGFHALGLGFISNKTIEKGNGIKIWAGQPLRWWDLCSGTMGFSQNLGWEMGIRPPPLFRTLLIRWRFYLFLKTENSRRVVESRSVCMGLYLYHLFGYSNYKLEEHITSNACKLWMWVAGQANSSLHFLNSS